MKVMVVGSGGREHAIIKKLKLSNEIDEIFALPGNGGMAEDATCVNVGAKDIDGLVKFATEINPTKQNGSPPGEPFQSVKKLIF